jgi:hypothetical protein
MSTKTAQIGLSASELVLVNRSRGLTVIPESTPLTRLNYFDGKFLRASDLTAEQTYLRKLVQLSNQASGSGIAYGLSVQLGSGDTLRVSPGLAITPEGQVILMPNEAVLSVEKLIEASRRQTTFTASRAIIGSSEFGDCIEAAATPPDDVLRAENLYLITAAPAEALCGEEDVFGKLCEEACATSKDRPYRVEGVIFRATPLLLATPLPDSGMVALGAKHLRSRVASAYFEDERSRIASLISGDGLKSELWCLGAEPARGTEVAIGVISRPGGTTAFLDVWIARRELMDSPARRYWQWRMAMRPWDVFLAQVLQFQCQLRDAMSDAPIDDDEDPCVRNSKLVAVAAQQMAEVTQFYAAATRKLATVPLEPGEQRLEITGGQTALDDLHRKLQIAGELAFLPSDRVMIERGIVELPSGGYLPVVPGANTTVNSQIKRFMGPGVNLRFCVVRPDYVAHALEEVQHMERISLLQGLEDEAKKPDVDILVPNGVIVSQKAPPGSAFRASLRIGDEGDRGSRLRIRRAAAAAITQRTEFDGVGRVEASEAGPVQMFVAAEATRAPGGSSLPTNSRLSIASVWLTGTCRDNPFAPGASSTSSVELRFTLVPQGDVPGLDFVDVLINGTFYHGTASTSGSSRIVQGTLSGSFSRKIGTSARSGGAISLLVDARLSPGGADPLAQPPRLRLSLREAGEKDGLGLEFAWKGTPLQISLTSLTPDVGDMSLIQDSDVLDDNDRSNARARAALQQIMRALTEASFEEQALANLFPAPPAPVDDLIVQGTLDWVLFHRRRRKQCSEEVRRPETAPPRSYQMHHLLFSGAIDNFSLESIIEAVRNNRTEVLTQLPFRQASLVEFLPLSQDLISQPASILADWNQLKPAPGADLVYAAVGSTEDAEKEGSSLATARLKRVVTVLEPVSKPASNAVSEVLDAPPDALPAGPDGVIVIITAPVATSCNSIFRAPSQDVFTRVQQLIQAGQIAQALPQLRPVHTVQFNRGTAQPVESSFTGLGAGWQTAGGGNVGQTLVVFREGDTTTPNQQLAEQGRLIMNRIQAGATPGVEVIASPADLGVDCPAVTIILGIPGGGGTPPGPFSFVASAAPVPIQPTINQIVGEAVLLGSGGDPARTVTLNVSIFLNAPIDNPDDRPARLVIDDPAEEKEGENMFLGRPTPNAANGREFPGVKLQYPGNGRRTFRFKNVSCDASTLGGGSVGIPSQVQMFISISPAGDAPLQNPQVTVAFVTGSQ